MDRIICLIRHGEPTRIDDQKRCISRTDLPLSPAGRKQAQAVGRSLSDQGLTAVFSSPLKRCTETAQILAPSGLAVRTVKGLEEVSVGAWEGLAFSEIKKRWPELYAQRGEHIGSCPPPGGESFSEAGLRLDRTLREILSETEGNIAVVTHGGAARGWLAPLMDVDPDDALSIRQPWGGITSIRWDGEHFAVLCCGIRPELPDMDDIRNLYLKAKTPDQVIAHCRAVAACAARLSEHADIDRDLLKTACLLHDLCRTEGKRHPAAAAKLLDAQGWPELAEIIRQHHDLENDPPAEAELLALADRMTDGTVSVTIQARFEGSRKKCTTDEALAGWRRRYDETIRLEQKYAEVP